MLNAPIDTRVYFKMGPNYWVDNPSGDPASQWANPSLAWELQYSPRGRQVFDQHYLWRQYYDPATKKYVYGVWSPTKDEPILELPELPSGQVPLAHRVATGKFDDAVASDGPDAPDDQVCWENLRSGTIRIYAASIKLCEECAKAVGEGNASLPAGRDFDDEEKGVFFQASGLKGGRGGAGSLPPCVFDPPPGGTFTGTCGRLTSKTGGLSGSSGKGGDAGDVYLYLVNNHRDLLSDSATVRLRYAADIRGGKPPQIYRQRTLSYDYIKASTGFRDGFVLEGPDDDAWFKSESQKLVGKDGNKDMNDLRTAEALTQISALLMKAEIAGNYAIDIMISAVRDNPMLFSTSPMDSLYQYLSAELSRLQSVLVAQVSSSLFSSSAPLEYSQFFETLDCDLDYYVGVPSKALEFIRHLCQFRGVSVGEDDNPLRNFIFRTGGLFRSVQSDFDVDVRHANLLIELNHLEQMTGALIDEISKIHLMMYEKVTDDQKTTMASHIKNLEERIAAIDAPAKSANFADQFKQIGEIVAHFGKGAAGIESSDWVDAGTEIYRGWQEFGNTVTNANVQPDLTAQRWMLEQAIQQAREDFRAFADRTIEEKREIIKLENNNLSDIMESRKRVENIKTDIQFRFSEVVDAVIIDYLQTPFDQNGRLASDLLKVSDLIEHPESAFGALGLQRLNYQCGVDQAPQDFAQATGQLGCVLVQARQNSYAIISTDILKGFPLVIMSPGSQRIFVSFGHLFDKNSMEEVNFVSEVNCVDRAIDAVVNRAGGLDPAAAKLGFNNEQGLRDVLKAICRRWVNYDPFREVLKAD
jgi:hypothetical protein